MDMAMEEVARQLKQAATLEVERERQTMLKELAQEKQQMLLEMEHARAMATLGVEQRREQMEAELQQKSDSVRELQERLEREESVVRDAVLKTETILTLNVGGQLFMTSKQTLRHSAYEPHATSYFHSLFVDRLQLPREANGAYFLDRDPTMFRHVLNWLRAGRIPQGLSAHEKGELLAEANYYLLRNLAAALKRPEEPEPKSDFSSQLELLRFFVTLKEAGVTVCTGVSFYRCNLQGLDLRGFHFIDCDMRHANLKDCLLSGANFSGANLAGAILAGCKLDRADFTHSVLKGADLSGANVGRANFSESNVDGAVFRRAILWSKEGSGTFWANFNGSGGAPDFAGVQVLTDNWRKLCGVVIDQQHVQHLASVGQ